jgi:hypothetical protein
VRKRWFRIAWFSETVEGTGEMLESDVEEGTVYSKSPWYRILGVEAGAPLLGSEVCGMCRDANLTFLGWSCRTNETWTIRGIKLVLGISKELGMLATTADRRQVQPPLGNRHSYSLPAAKARVNSTNVLDEGLRIGEVGRLMNSKVKSVKQDVYRK